MKKDGKVFTTKQKKVKIMVNSGIKWSEVGDKCVHGGISSCN